MVSIEGVGCICDEVEIESFEGCFCVGFFVGELFDVDGQVCGFIFIFQDFMQW